MAAVAGGNADDCPCMPSAWAAAPLVGAPARAAADGGGDCRRSETLAASNELTPADGAAGGAEKAIVGPAAAGVTEGAVVAEVARAAGACGTKQLSQKADWREGVGEGGWSGCSSGPAVGAAEGETWARMELPWRERRGGNAGAPGSRWRGEVAVVVVRSAARAVATKVAVTWVVVVVEPGVVVAGGSGDAAVVAVAAAAEAAAALGGDSDPDSADMPVAAAQATAAVGGGEAVGEVGRRGAGGCMRAPMPRTCWASPSAAPAGDSGGGPCGAAGSVTPGRAQGGGGEGGKEGGAEASEVAACDPEGSPTAHRGGEGGVGVGGGMHESRTWEDLGWVR